MYGRHVAHYSFDHISIIEPDEEERLQHEMTGVIPIGGFQGTLYSVGSRDFKSGRRKEKAIIFLSICAAKYDTNVRVNQCWYVRNPEHGGSQGPGISY